MKNVEEHLVGQRSDLLRFKGAYTRHPHSVAQIAKLSLGKNCRDEKPNKRTSKQASRPLSIVDLSLSEHGRFRFVS